jgi:hypothetical protein
MPKKRLCFRQMRLRISIQERVAAVNRSLGTEAPSSISSSADGRRGGRRSFQGFGKQQDISKHRR